MIAIILKAIVKNKIVENYVSLQLNPVHSEQKQKKEFIPQKLFEEVESLKFTVSSLEEKLERLEEKFPKREQS